MEQAVGKLLAEDDHEVYLALAEQLGGLGLGLHLALRHEVFVGIQLLRNLLGIGIVAAVEHRHADVLHLVLDDEARQHHHDLRHHQQDEQRARVAQDMDELLSYE